MADALKREWKPTPKQAEFLSVPFSVKEAFYGGGAGSGKSDVLLMYPIIHKLHENPKFKQVFMRRTYPELRNEIVPRSREIYRHFGAVFNATNMTWTFPRPDQYGSGAYPEGAMIFLGHCDTENDVHKYDSMEINLYTPDELTSFSEWMYLYIGFTRTRTSHKELPAIIRAAGMPGNIGHTWVKNRFVRHFPLGGKLILGKGGNKRIYIHSTAADNPHIDPNYLPQLEALPEAEKQAKKYGSWDAYLGQVFEEFRDKQYPDEPLNALHVIEPFTIPDWWPRLVAIDWGYTPPAMTYVSYGAISPSKRVYIYREQFWQKTKIEVWAPYVREFLDSENPRVVKLCRSANQERGGEHTILQQIESALGRPMSLSNNSPHTRVATKMLLHEYLRWTSKPIIQSEQSPYDENHAQWLIRNRTLKEYNSYIKQYEPPEDETNLPKLQIFKTCPKLTEAIRSCVYSETTPEDVAQFDGDDPYDTLRYLIDEADRYFDDSLKEYDKLRAQESIVNQLQATGDMTAFYRNARHLEKSNKKVAIRRFSRRIH